MIKDEAWYTNEFIPCVQKRGAAIIAARKLSSALSAAQAISDHMHDWVLGTPAGKFVSMAVDSTGASLPRLPQSSSRAHGSKKLSTVYWANAPTRVYAARGLCGDTASRTGCYCNKGCMQRNTDLDVLSAPLVNVILCTCGGPCVGCFAFRCRQLLRNC